MAIYDFFVSRNGAVSNAANYVGHKGRLFYDNTNGVIKLSDGVTPGGLSIPYTIATSTVVGGIKAGPGANVSVDGTLTIDTAGLPLGIGNLSITDTTISTVNPNEDVVLETNGSGNVSLVGNVFFHPTNGPTLTAPYFKASSDGQITILVPAADPAAGAVKIIGSTTGRVSPPLNTGVMLQLTGNNDDPCRLYNDAIGAFAAFVGRRINGNLTVPTAVQAGDEIIRISSTGHNGTAVSPSGSARIVYQAIENYTPSATGSNISIWTCAVGSNTLSKIVTVDSASGLTATKATVQGNLIVGGNLIGNITTTTATVNNVTVTGNITANAATIDGIVIAANAIYSNYTATDISFGQLAATANINLNRTTVHARDAWFNANVRINNNNAIASGFNKSGGTVTANGTTGQLTTLADSIAKGAVATFTVNNNFVTSKDVVIVNIASGGSTASYAIAVTAVANGSFQVSVTNNGVGALAEALVINFAVIKCN
jgi:hypothetical protein